MADCSTRASEASWARIVVTQMMPDFLGKKHFIWIGGMSPYGYVWTAPIWQGLFWRGCKLVGCGYVFGLFVRYDNRWP